MGGHADQAQQAYEAFANGDVERATENWADDIVWQGPNSTELPGGGEHKGKQEALDTLAKAVGAWDEFTLHMDEFFEKGDSVVALGHAHVKKGDKEAKTPVVHILRWEDGGRIKRFQILTDTFQSAQILGIA
jgi:uncharacterized protein